MRKFFSSDILQVLALVAAGVALVSVLLLTGNGSTRLSEKASEEKFWTFKVDAAHSYDVVVIGDSRAYRGFDPSVFNKETGLRAMNLGFSSAGFAPSLFALAERHLKTEGPKLIILAVTPFSLTEEAASNEHLSQWASRARSDLYVTRYLERYLLYLSPHALKAVSANPEKNPYHQQFFDDGFVHSRREQNDIESGVRIYREQFKQHKVSRQRLDDLISKLREWQAKGIKIAAYRPPVAPEMRQAEDEMSGWLEADIVTKLKATNVKWLEFEPEAFESYDGSHLTGDSARELSLQIARELKK